MESQGLSRYNDRLQSRLSVRGRVKRFVCIPEHRDEVLSLLLTGYRERFLRDWSDKRVKVTFCCPGQESWNYTSTPPQGVELN
jgi:hypothetical protein